MLTHHNLADEIDYEGPHAFALADLQTVGDLFSWRCALTYTPTCEIPGSYVGSGPLCIRFPVVTPCCLLQQLDTRGFGGPRFWLNLLQRETGKIRCKPLTRPHVSITRFDAARYPDDDVACGVKALIDSLKVSTTGRSDGMLLHYFGAITDDGPGQISLSIKQMDVPEPRQAFCQVKLENRT